MSSRFRITKTDDAEFPWALDYPAGFDELLKGNSFKTFDDVVAGFIEATEAWCPICGKGTVVDRYYGWECTSCEAYDVAVGCERL